MKKLTSFLLGITLNLLLIAGLANAVSMGDASNEDTTVVEPIDSGEYEEHNDTDCDGDTHEHIHYNDATDSSTEMSIGVVHAFAIVFEDDFMENVETGSLMCSNGDNTYYSCSFDKETDLGEVVYSDSAGHWNGVTVTYQEMEWIDGSPKGLLWEYGTNDPENYDNKPWIGAGGQKTEGVGFYLEDNTAEYSVTTTSWTKMEYFSADPDDYENTDTWSHEYTTQAEANKDEIDSDGDYIYWYGLNGTGKSTFPACETPVITCSHLEISPLSGAISVDEVFGDVPFTVTAYGSDGTTESDITADSTFQYYANRYDASNPLGDNIFNTSGDANGTLAYQFFNFTRLSNTPETTDSTVTFRDTEPGDNIYVYVSDYEGTAYPDCYAEVFLPYCRDLDITDPTGLFGSSFVGNFSSTTWNTNITVEATASNGQPWPYNIVYSSYSSTGALDSATFDGNTNPYTTNDYSVDDYENTASAQVNVDLGSTNGTSSDDVAGFCNDSFTYTLVPEEPEEEDQEISRNTCEDLSITTTGPISAADMEAGNVEISWTTVNTDGDPIPGPYTCTSSNPTGSFTDASGQTGTGSIITNDTTVYYTGEAGDSINCRSNLFPLCTDNITSETPSGDVYVCNDLTLSDPYIWADGLKVPIDPTDPTSVQDLYDEGTVCYDWITGVSDPAFAGTLMATAYNSSMTDISGTLRLTVTERSGTYTGNPGIGNPTSVGVTGEMIYSGTLCWDDYSPDNVVTLEMLGELACSDADTLPPEPLSTPVCEDLSLSPDSVTISSSASDAGTLDLVINVLGSDDAWSGTLIVEKTGEGTLYYPDLVTPSEFEDGHLEIPMSGANITVDLIFVGGTAGTVVTASIETEEGACTDNFTISKETNGGNGSNGNGNGNGETHGGSNVCEANVNPGDDDLICGDDYEIEICPDEDITVTSSDDEEICAYLDEDGDGRQDSDEDTFCEDGSLKLEDSNGDCYQVTVENVCGDTDISVEDSSGKVCYDTSFEAIKEGEFNKYIYTFNFSAEKSAYTDQGVFFAHDEDRAFYTLDYRPAGTENEIVFTDDMWDNGSLEATNGEGGTVNLAESSGELTRGSAYSDNYSYATILNYGFGESHEINSGALVSEIETTYTDLSTGERLFPSFIPYIQYDDPNKQSRLIDACTDTDGDGDTDENENTNVCYDPVESPANTSDPKVVILNAGTVSDGTIRIRYVGVIKSALNCTGNTDDSCLTEEFQNTAQVDAYPGSPLGQLEASARLVVICAYLLTENAGDVYLNEALTGGSNLACIEVNDGSSSIDYTSYSNTDGLIILDSGTSTSSTSSTESTASCDETSDGSLIGNLSSYVCEIVNSVSQLWRSATVESTTESHVKQATRNVSTDQNGAKMEFTAGTGESNWADLEAALSNNNNAGSRILYFDGTYENTSNATLTLGNLTVPPGAYTLIVENADLIIEGEITYADVTSTDYNNIPSIAFIVLNGNIHFQNSSDHNVGVYYTNQDFDGDSNGSSRSPVDQQLIIDGSLYGNIQPLLDDCRYVAPPTTEGGGLVVRYDSRILLNTPPSLSEYVDVSTEEGLN